jgi:heterodisulfide reductase subunit C
MKMKGQDAISRLNCAACYQCKRCTNGCPVTFAMDIYPDEVIRRVNLGQMERVLSCSTIWICSACETCTTRCPNEVDIAGVMDYLKELSLKKGIKPSQSRTYAFHESFLKEIEKRGRVFEGGLMQRYLFKSGDIYRKTLDFTIFEDLRLGLAMLKKGRMPLLPERIKGRREVKEIIKASQ